MLLRYVVSAASPDVSILTALFIAADVTIFDRIMLELASSQLLAYDEGEYRDVGEVVRATVNTLHSAMRNEGSAAHKGVAGWMRRRYNQNHFIAAVFHHLEVPFVFTIPAHNWIQMTIFPRITRNVARANSDDCPLQLDDVDEGQVHTQQMIAFASVLDWLVRNRGVVAAHRVSLATKYTMRLLGNLIPRPQCPGCFPLRTMQRHVSEEQVKEWQLDGITGDIWNFRHACNGTLTSAPAVHESARWRQFGIPNICSRGSYAAGYGKRQGMSHAWYAFQVARTNMFCLE
jgi:hypothetical protein